MDIYNRTDNLVIKLQQLNIVGASDNFIIDIVNAARTGELTERRFKIVLKMNNMELPADIIEKIFAACANAY